MLIGSDFQEYCNSIASMRPDGDPEVFSGQRSRLAALPSVLLSGPGFATLMIACSIIGLAIGGTYPLWMTLTADCFGAKSFGVVMGTMNFVVMPFSIVAIRFIGEVFDRTGSYDFAFKVFLGTAFVAAALILSLRLPAPQLAKR